MLVAQCDKPHLSVCWQGLKLRTEGCHLPRAERETASLQLVSQTFDLRCIPQGDRLFEQLELVWNHPPKECRDGRASTRSRVQVGLCCGL